MTDRLSLRGIEVLVHVGASEEERAHGHVLLVDVDCHVALARPGASDRLADALDYAALHAAVTDALRRRSFNLIESVAETAAAAALAFAPEVTVRVAKRNPPVPGGLVAAAEVEIRRARV